MGTNCWWFLSFWFFYMVVPDWFRKLPQRLRSLLNRTCIWNCLLSPLTCLINNVSGAWRRVLSRWRFNNFTVQIFRPDYNLFKWKSCIFLAILYCLKIFWRKSMFCLIIGFTSATFNSTCTMFLSNFTRVQFPIKSPLVDRKKSLPATNAQVSEIPISMKKEIRPTVFKYANNTVTPVTKQNHGNGNVMLDIDKDTRKELFIFVTNRLIYPAVIFYWC